MIIMPFAPEHLEQLRDNQTQGHIGVALRDPAYIQTLVESDGWTAIENGKVLGSAGLIPVWQGHTHAWALLAADCGPAGMLLLTRAILRMLKMQAGRIQTVVEADFVEGQRWMKVLGFTRETPDVMRKWYPDGSDAILYSRVT